MKAPWNVVRLSETRWELWRGRWRCLTGEPLWRPTKVPPQYAVITDWCPRRCDGF